MEFRIPRPSLVEHCGRNMNESGEFISKCDNKFQRYRRPTCIYCVQNLGTCTESAPRIEFGMTKTSMDELLPPVLLEERSRERNEPWVRYRPRNEVWERPRARSKVIGDIKDTRPHEQHLRRRCENATPPSARNRYSANDRRLYCGSVLDLYHNCNNHLTRWTRREIQEDAEEKEEEEVEEVEEETLCQICFDSVEGRRRSCCCFVTCHTCWDTYISGKVAEGVEEIECPNCYAIIPYEVVLMSLSMDLRDRLLNKVTMDDAISRPCPCCGHLTTVSTDAFVRQEGGNRTEYAVTWCFTCKRLWHLGREYRMIEEEEEVVDGERGLREWASQRNPDQGYQLNARQCPSCKVYIQRMSGCEHMTCACGAHFCYACGKRIFSGSKLRFCKKLLQKIVGCRC